MSTLVKVYSSLLADISMQSGVPLGLPVDFDISWVLLQGPKLDKELLQHIEGNGESPKFPEWLIPLWNCFIANNSSAAILRMLRTLLVFGYKAEHEPTQDQLADAQKAFVEANRGVGVWNEFFKSSSPTPLFREARRLVGAVIYRANFSEIFPKHGPGAVFPPSRASQKGDFNVCTPISEYYPYDTVFNGLPQLGYDDAISPSAPIEKIVCKMVAVPKDSRGPRLISVHPKEAIWVQQGQRFVLEQAITSNRLTRGRINFRDQSINGQLALISSKSRANCTIDLKEASDRIGKALVDYLFGWSSKILSCSRATSVRLLDGRLEELEMWAPMGNCLTFPVESLIFWSLARAGILCRYGQHCDDVYVFGDDIIVPSQYYEGAIYGLVSAGLIPNFGKTFRKGFFRESCGVDAYNGEDVTPFRMKVMDVISYSSAESACDLAKRLRRAGYRDSSATLYSEVSKQHWCLSLTNNPDCQGLIEYTDYDFWKLQHYERRLRLNRKLHRFEVPYHRVVRSTEDLTHHAWWHVQDSLLALERKSRGFSDSSWEERKLFPTENQLANRGGLEYPSPRGERLSRGWSTVLCPPVGLFELIERLTNS